MTLTVTKKRDWKILLCNLHVDLQVTVNLRVKFFDMIFLPAVQVNLYSFQDTKGVHPFCLRPRHIKFIAESERRERAAKWSKF